jgi:hypothetical protein
MLSVLKFFRSILPEDLILKSKSLSVFEYLCFYFLSLGAKKRLLKSWDEYRNNGTVPKNIEQIIILANFRTRGEIRSQVVRNDVDSNSTSKSTIFTPSIVSQSIQELNDKGYCKIGNLKGLKIFDELCGLYDSPVFAPTKYLNHPQGKNLSSSTPNPELSHIWHVNPDLVIANSGFKAIVQDEFWREISYQYLKSVSKISAVRCWHSFPSSSRQFLSPENWHLDAGDGLNFLKFFILLSDVDDLSGPTAVVPLRSDQLSRKFYTGRRFSDNEINGLLNKHKINEIKATGSAGTVYAMDTRLIHRGTPVIQGKRFLLNFTVSVDNFGGNSKENYNLKNDEAIAAYFSN